MIDVEFDKATNIRPSIALEFTGELIRVMQFDNRENNTFELRSFCEVAMPPNSMEEGRIINPRETSQLVLEALETCKPRIPSSTYAISVIDQQHTFFITLEFPILSKEELRSLLSRQIKDILPMAESDVYWDWHRLPQTENKIPIQIAAVPKVIIDSHTDTLVKAKLTPLLFEPRTLSSARLITTVDPKAQKRFLTIDVSRNSYYISLVQNGELAFVAEQPVQPINTKENVRILRRKISEVLEYGTGKENQEISEMPIFLYGKESTAVTDLLDEFIQAGFKNTSRINYSMQGEDQAHDLGSKNKDSYIALMGAAIKGMARPKEDRTALNLVPQLAKDTFRRREMASTLRNYLVFVAVNVCLLVILTIATSAVITQRVTDLEQRYAAVINFSESEKVIELEKAIGQLNSTSAETRNLIAKIYDWGQILELLNRVTPAGVTLINTVVDLDSNLPGSNYWIFTVSGQAQDRINVIEMTEALRNSDLVENVKLPLESLEAGSDVRFVIEAQIPFDNLLKK